MYMYRNCNALCAIQGRHAAQSMLQIPHESRQSVGGWTTCQHKERICLHTRPRRRAPPRGGRTGGGGGGMAGRGACLLDGQHVHAVYLEAGGVVAAGVEGVALAAPRLAGAHAVVVVLADEQTRQVPQSCNVQRLEQLPLVGRPVAVPAGPGEP